MSIIIKIGKWIVKWPLKVSWIVVNDKWVESWRWCGESPGQEGENLGNLVKTKISKIKLTIFKYTKVRSIN